MPINRNHKIIFVHIPKNAGTSIEVYLGMMGPNSLYGSNSIEEDGITFSPQHLTPPLLKKYLGNDTYNNCFTFSFTRNPYERIVSEFYWQKRYGVITKLTENITNDVDFKTWFFSFYKNMNADHKLPQHRYIYDNTGTSMVDFIGKVENINEDFLNVLEKTGYKGNGNLKKLNVNPKSCDTSMIDSEIKEKIIDIYKKDFEYFGYKK